MSIGETRSRGPTLSKEIKLRQLFTLAFGTIIGVGWILVLGDWLEFAGSVGAMLGFLGGGFIIMLIGLCYAEAATMFPVAGGEVAYAYEMYGANISFLAGWIIVLAYIAGTAFEAIAVGWLLGGIAPGLQGPVLYTLLGEDIRLGTLLIGLAIMLVIAAVSYRGVRGTTALQDVMIFGFIGICLVFIGAGLIGGDVANLEPMFIFDEKGSVIPGVVAVLAMTPFFYVGFDVIPQAMGEKADNVTGPHVARAIILSIGAACLFYVLIIGATSMVLPRADLLGLDLPTAAAFQAAFNSPLLGKAVLIAGLLGLITSWNAIFYAATRVLYALGRAHMLPPLFGRVHSNFRTPVTAIIFVTVVGSLGALLGRGAIIPIVNSMSAAMAFVFALICFGVIRLRRTGPERNRPYLIPGGLKVPITAAIGALIMTSISLYQGYVRAAGEFPAEWSILIAWMLLGVLFWAAGRKFGLSMPESDRRQLILGESSSGVIETRSVDQAEGI